jgi:Flp pilus assembly protein TadD
VRLTSSVRLLVLVAAFLLTASSAPAQKEPRGAATRNVDSEHTGQAHGVFSTQGQFELQTSVVPDAVPPSGTVSAQELRLPAKANKEFALSMKSFQAGDYLATASHLEKTTKLAPDYVQAHNNLGAIYINLHRYDDAVTELRKTIELSPNLEAPYHNLALLQILLNRLPEAEEAARHAIALSPNMSPAQFTLGRILALQHRYTLEAVQVLTSASIQTPAARLVLANILENRGEYEPAIAALRTYLRNPDPAKKTRMETWLRQLELKASRASKSDIAELPVGRRVDP